MILLTCKTLRETRLRIKAVRDITLTLTRQSTSDPWSTGLDMFDGALGTVIFLRLIWQ